MKIAEIVSGSESIFNLNLMKFDESSFMQYSFQYKTRRKNLKKIDHIFKCVSDKNAPKVIYFE